MKVGLTTTVKLPLHDEISIRRSSAVFFSFISFHLNIGFDHIYVFFDESSPEHILTRTYEYEEDCVTFFINEDEKLAWQRQHCSTFASLEQYLAEEVTARQTVNAEHALLLSLERGLDWLLHLDIDELFYTAACSIRPHFEMLTELGVLQMTYANHEGIPEKIEVDNYFEEITLFRKHFLNLPLRQDVRASMQFWERRTSHQQYFLAYDNGKSAVRVLSGVIPKNVHEWILPEGKTITNNAQAIQMNWQNCKKTALLDPRNLDPSAYLECEDPCILHFVNCGYNWFKEKYTILGSFASSWFGGELPIPPCFHLDARDAVVDGSDGQVLEFYKKQVLFEAVKHPEELQAQLTSGVCFRLSGISRFLSSKPRDKNSQSMDLIGQESIQSKGIEDKISTDLKHTTDFRETEDGAKGDPGIILNDAHNFTIPKNKEEFNHKRAWILSSVTQQFL